MNKEMIISSTSHETRVAILEDDQVVEIFIEREHSRGVVGNIYKGRVSKVLPGMQSAFVDLDLERDAFLYVSDVISPTEEVLEKEDDDIGLAAFDDIPWFPHTAPPITTISQPTTELGRVAVRALADLISGKPARSTVLPAHLVVRRSCGEPETSAPTGGSHT